jgi:tetratricopeptide (TPR) repeat protein
VDIAALKEEARALEQQGRTAEALALYRKTLARLEGTPGILRELPLYVKAGDLNLKLGDGKAAIAMYERAAKRYAQYGSSKSVIALCSKILRVAPARTYAYLSLARLMIERGHVSEAAKVLASYAERVNLGKAQEVIGNLAELDADQTRPVLEMLLEVAGRRWQDGLRVRS